MKRTYIQPTSENVSLCMGGEVALNIGIGEGSITTQESGRKDVEDDIEWEDWEEE